MSKPQDGKPKEPHSAGPTRYEELVKSGEDRVYDPRYIDERLQREATAGGGIFGREKRKPMLRRMFEKR